ncbi:NrtA/SsuA/CpmA family ABC transporter substrate-binding protein [Actimicrobium antarcticum]|uniref:SsuA/THI5-like domain-containing protein n=1 Tax=Actimicrobium antarcticum TaxID=1051899 RepID=A0ABP7TKW0_9BURK
MKPASDVPGRRLAVGRHGLLWLTLLAAALAGIAIAAFVLMRTPAVPLAPLPAVTIAVPMQLNSASLIVASAQDLFRQQGVDVIEQPFLLGKDALQSVIDGKADLAVVADTPLVFALSRGEDIAMLAGISRGRRSLAIVTRNDRGIRRMQDLAGKSVGLSKGTNFTYFLDAMLQVHEVPGDQVKLVDLKTDDAIQAFKDGSVDAIVMFQPFTARLQAEMGDRITVFYGEEVYAFRFILTGKPTWIDKHPHEIRQILTALIAANKVIHDDPLQTRRTVGQALRIDDAIMATLFDPDDYMVSLDQAMLLALDDQTRWAVKQGLITLPATPNYLRAMRYRDLEAVRPAAVTFVR